jgi:hypothetical protein
VQLVNKYVDLKTKKKKFNDEMDDEIQKLEEALFSFSEKENADVVFGSKNKIRIKETEQIKFPYKNSKERVELEKLLKDKGIWNEVDQLDTTALNKLLNEKTLDKKMKDKISKFIKIENSKRIYMSKI